MLLHVKVPITQRFLHKTARFIQGPAPQHLKAGLHIPVQRKTGGTTVTTILVLKTDQQRTAVRPIVLHQPITSQKVVHQLTAGHLLHL